MLRVLPSYHPIAFKLQSIGMQLNGRACQGSAVRVAEAGPLYGLQAQALAATRRMLGMFRLCPRDQANERDKLAGLSPSICGTRGR